MIDVFGNQIEDEPMSISLIGTQATMKLVQENKIIAVPDTSKWISKKPFALLVEDTGKKSWYKDINRNEINIYHHLGLVELGSGERLKSDVRASRDIIIGSNSEQYQSRIEILPK